MWRKVRYVEPVANVTLCADLMSSWYVALPAIIVSSIYVYQLEKEHEEHLAHAM